jgi:GATA-binding protein
LPIIESDSPSISNIYEKRHAFLDPNTTTASALATSILPRPQVDDSFRRPSILQVFDLPAFKIPSTVHLDDKLPSIGHDRSRPSSSSTVASYTQQRHGSNASIQLPSLATLASAASNCPAAANMNSNDSNDNTRKETPEKKMPSPLSKPSNGLSMSYATSAPATAGGQAGSPPVCQNCSTSTTPLWRRDENGSVLCNACGLFLKLHGRPRPISLKTDVIKSRNRVKTGGPGGRKRTSDQGGLPAAHPDADGQLGLAQHRRASGKISSGLSDRSNSPISRTGTPNFNHPANIAPQHMFEQALHSDFHSPSMPGFGLRAPSPATSSINGSHLEAPLPYDALAAQNTVLRTRVSEMELINDLFRNRVTELEQSEQSARQTESTLRQELDEVKQREADLKRRLDEYENDSPRQKRMKMSDISDLVDESRAGTPINAMGE